MSVHAPRMIRSRYAGGPALIPVRLQDPPEVIRAWRQAGVAEAGCFGVGPCKVMVSREPLGRAGELRWHLSISHDTRYPTWDEIADARYALVPDECFMVMVLPPSGEYVNAHPHCFHLHEVPEACDVTVST